MLLLLPCAGLCRETVSWCRCLRPALHVLLVNVVCLVSRACSGSCCSHSQPFSRRSSLQPAQVALGLLRAELYGDWGGFCRASPSRAGRMGSSPLPGEAAFPVVGWRVLAPLWSGGAAGFLPHHSTQSRGPPTHTSMALVLTWDPNKWRGKNHGHPTLLLPLALRLPHQSQPPLSILLATDPAPLSPVYPAWCPSPGLDPSPSAGSSAASVS